jgi:hypothetical protein
VFGTENMGLSIILIENEKDELVGIAPFYSVKRLLGKVYPIKRLMFLGSKFDGDGSVGSEYMDIISREGEEEGIVQSLFDCIAKNKFCDEIYLSRMDTSSIVYNLLKKAVEDERIMSIVFEESKSPYIKLPSEWGEYVNGLSSSMRYKIRRERRNLEKSANITIRKTREESELDSDFQEFIRLHQARWVSRNIAGAFSSDKFTMFHKRLVISLMKSGFLELVFLSIDGCNKAAVYNIVYNNKVYFYLSGLDTNHTKGSLGLYLHSVCIEDAIKKGCSEYDFMLKGKLDGYKDHWTKDTRTLADLYIAHPGITTHYMRAREFARTCYHRIKLFISRNSEKM